MDELATGIDDLQTTVLGVMDAGQAVTLRLSELAVTYSFSILGAVLLLIGGYVLAGVVERGIYAGLRRFRGFDETLRKFLSKTARYALLVLVGVTALAQFGVQTASIIAALGAAGLAIGLALQGTLQNIAAGIMLLALRPFRVGEAIEAGGISGTVQEVGLFATELQTGDGLFLLAPNSQLWNTPVTNFSRNPRRAHNLTVRIGRDDDIDKAIALLRGIVAGDARVFADPAPHAYVGALGDTAVELTIRYWTATADWWQAQLDFTRAVKRAFEENGISVPLPRHEVRQIAPPRNEGDDAMR